MLATTALFGATFLSAPQPRLSPETIGEMIDAALFAVVPPDSLLSQMRVGDRGVQLDYARTLPAFGLPDDSASRAQLRLRSRVTPSTVDLARDCNQMGSLPCTAVGQAVYVMFEPVSTQASTAIVWLRVYWAASAGTRRFLTGYSTQVHLARTSRGRAAAPWHFVRTGLTVVM
jgi:hypothetical protein